ncbi:MAG: hypothetical protein V3W14_08680 [Candidatus Neomarinimicrobiota bacterium]
MRKYLVLTITLVAALQGGIGDPRISLLLEARGGLFRPGPETFPQIYTDGEILQGAAVGIGYKEAYIVARYRGFEATGQSDITGADLLEGRAEWRQEIISLGLRSYESKPFYIELAYAIASVEESVSTKQPGYTALNATFNTTDRQGISAALGITLPFLLAFNLTADAEFIYIPLNESEGVGTERINLGGPILSLGLTVVF